MVKWQRDLILALKLMTKATAENGLAAVNIFESLRNENVAMWRLIQSAVIFTNPDSRRIFGDVLARMETRLDFSAARLNAAIA